MGGGRAGPQDRRCVGRNSAKRLRKGDSLSATLTPASPKGCTPLLLSYLVQISVDRVQIIKGVIIFHWPTPFSFRVMKELSRNGRI